MLLQIKFHYPKRSKKEKKTPKLTADQTQIGGSEGAKKPQHQAHFLSFTRIIIPPTPALLPHYDEPTRLFPLTLYPLLPARPPNTRTTRMTGREPARASEYDVEADDYTLHRPAKSKWRTTSLPLRIVLTVAIAQIVLTTFVAATTRIRPGTPPRPIARAHVGDLYTRQSQTLSQALARYTLRTGIAPPPNYDKWLIGKYAYADNVRWEEKIAKIFCWHGLTGANGGMIMGRHFARFRLADLARENPGLMDVNITRFAETLCEVELGCDRERVMAEYNITGSADARENLYKYKYVVDVDGTTFSGWFLGLLRSGSLVFKSTIFEEYFNDWLRPFEHFVSVLPDLSDLVQKIEWANANLAEARLIQRRG
ncbi:hypothetical protein C8J57DRAFT_1480501 [Mycena rebaudengoi]|nr:hypothetical protein C8J57DRAFT_1480501 [Mycena rebaudengoi]